MAQLAIDHFGAVSASSRTEETTVGLQSDGRSGEAQRGKLSRHHTAFCGTSGMEGFGHGAEVLAQATRLARGEAQRATRRLNVESQHARCGCGRADGATGRRAVESVLVVARQDCFGNL